VGQPFKTAITNCRVFRAALQMPLNAHGVNIKMGDLGEFEIQKTLNNRKYSRVA